MAKSKPKWKITRHKNSGQLLFSYYERRQHDSVNLEEVEPYSFHDTLTFENYYNAPSGIEIRWKSEFHPNTILSSSMELLNDFFRARGNSRLQILNASPFAIKGEFKFVKRGSEIRIIEVLDE